MNSRLRILNYSLIGLIIVISSIFVIQSSRNRKEIRKEKQAGQILNESNEKLKKEISLLRNDFTNNSQHYSELVAANEKTIADNNAKIQKLLNDNRLGESAKRKVKELEKNNQTLQRDIDDAKYQYDQLSTQTEKLNKQITELTAQNSQMAEQLEVMKKLRSDNISISAMKGKKSKLTITAARTNMISATLDLPSSSANNLHYSIVFPGGTKVESKDMPNSEIRLEPGLSDAISDGDTKSAIIKFEPRQKLKKGRYKLLVYSGNEYLTGMYINLR